MQLSDLRKMSDADLISAASDIVWSYGKLEENSVKWDMIDSGSQAFKELREIVDELHYRWVIRAAAKAPRPEQGAQTEQVPSTEPVQPLSAP